MKNHKDVTMASDGIFILKETNLAGQKTTSGTISLVCPLLPYPVKEL